MKLRELVGKLTEKRDRLNQILEGLLRLGAADMDIDITPESTDGLRCEKCKADDFGTPQALGRHRKACDGVRRSKEERHLHSARRSLQKRKSKPDGHDREPSRGPLPKVACEECGEKFPDAKSMGIHKTRVHFTSESGGRRSTVLG